MNDNKVFGPQAQDALLILAGSSTIGLVLGWLIGSFLGQDVAGFIIGGLLGLLAGAIITLVRIESNATATHHDPNPHGGKADPEMHAWPSNSVLVIEHVWTEDEIPLKVRLYLQYRPTYGRAGADAAPSSGTSSNTPGAATTVPTNAVHALVETTTRRVIRRMTVEAVRSLEQLTPIEQSIVDEVNVELKSLGAEVGMLVISEIALPDDVTAARQAMVIQELRDQAKRQAEAVRIQTLHKQLQAVDGSYGRVKGLRGKKSRRHQYVLLQLLLDLRSQSGSDGVWPVALDELIEELEQYDYSEVPSV